MSVLTWKSRFALAVSAALCLLSLSAVPSFAAPKVNFLTFTGPVAYDLKSHLTTRFYASVDTTGVWAELKVRTPRGDKYIYKGPIKDANKNFYFPLWNGMGPDGRRLPSSSYEAVLKISKGGESGTFATKITVSRIYFMRRGYFDSESTSMWNEHEGYMVPGSANCYLTIAAEGSALGIRPVIWDVKPGTRQQRPLTHQIELGTFTCDPGASIQPTVYLRGSNAILAKDVLRWQVYRTSFLRSGDLIAYQIIVVQ